MAEQPTAPEEYRQLRRALMEKVLDRAESDASWRQQLVEDPEAALDASGFPEVAMLRRFDEGIIPTRLSDEESEVMGHAKNYNEGKSNTVNIAAPSPSTTLLFGGGFGTAASFSPGFENEPTP
jgi:hypothetical protein